MTIDSIEVLFQQELKDLYDAEKRLTKAIPKMAKAAGSDELKTALTEHLEQTKNQVQRLEQVFEIVGVKAQAKACPGMKGIIEEGEEVIERDAEDTFADLGLVGAARRVEHYEMAGYRSLIALAEAMGQDQARELLEETLEEEQEADRRLEELGQQLLEQVSQAGDEDEEEDEDDEEVEEDEEEEQPAPARRGK